jgi:hypothetical protein
LKLVIQVNILFLALRVRTERTRLRKSIRQQILLPVGITAPIDCAIPVNEALSTGSSVDLFGLKPIPVVSVALDMFSQTRYELRVMFILQIEKCGELSVAT